MGSTGKTTGTYTDFSLYTNDSKMQHVIDVTERFKEISNIKAWLANLSEDDINVIRSFVGTEYGDINEVQYTIPWENMNSSDRYAVSALYNALNKFELNDGIIVNRATSFRIFGAKDDWQKMSIDEIKKYLDKTGGVVQNDGFMSFSTHADGYPVEADGLVIHLRIPKSNGAGAYIGNSYGVQDESEFLVNTNTVMRFDKNSLRTDENGFIHITADWLGRSKAQTISPTYKRKK